MSRSQLPVTLLSILAVVGTVLSVLVPAHWSDFLQYWSAWRMLWSGGNPYDPATMFVLQKTAAPGVPEPIMLWAPPWTPLLMSVALGFSYATAQTLWCIFGASLVVIAAWCWLDTINLRISLMTLLFAPLLFAVAHGQSVFLLPVGVTLLWLGYRQQRLAMMIAGLILLSIKPHLFLVFGSFFIVSAFRLRAARLVLLSGLFAMVSVLTVTQVLFPNALQYWWDALLHPPTGATTVLQWRGTNLVPWIRAFLQTAFDNRGDWVMPLVPLFGMLGIGYLATLTKWRELIDGNWGALIAVSYCLAPYGWDYDQIILFPLYLQLTSPLLKDGVWSKRQRHLAVICIALQLFTIVASVTVIHYGHQYWFYPLVMLGLWWADFLEREKALGGPTKLTISVLPPY